MSFVLYKVRSEKEIHFSSPLHWSNFYRDKQRLHHRLMTKRQDLILYLANLHATAISTGMPLGLIEIPMRFMSLRDWVQDFRIILDYFFNVKQLGYNLENGDHEISTITPKRLSEHSILAASKSAKSLKYLVPQRVDDTVISKVYTKLENREVILKKLSSTGRLDLHAPVEYLLSLPEHNFHFIKAGKLQLRDTSVWPVVAIETWPSWLREALFGEGLDIEAAYTQFLVKQLTIATKEQPNIMKLAFPDLLRAIHDKKKWRQELCEDVLGLPFNDANIGLIKKLCMGLANGSRISPGILMDGRSFSVTAELVFTATEDVSLENLTKIGNRLSRISNQYAHARKIICSKMLNFSPSRLNQKKVFESYFMWERKARYAIWEACGQHGIMVHDGIDGIPNEYLKNLPSIIDKLDITIS